ncbi:hypothetical protein ACIGKR_18885 [Rhodococcus qingshengii]
MHETAGQRVQDLYHRNEDTPAHGHIILLETYRKHYYLESH